MTVPNLPKLDEDTAQILITQFVKEFGYDFVRNCASEANEDQKYETRKEAIYPYTQKIRTVRGRDW